MEQCRGVGEGPGGRLVLCREREEVVLGLQWVRLVCCWLTVAGVVVVEMAGVSEGVQGVMVESEVQGGYSAMGY